MVNAVNVSKTGNLFRFPVDVLTISEIYNIIIEKPNKLSAGFHEISSNIIKGVAEYMKHPLAFFGDRSNITSSTKVFGRSIYTRLHEYFQRFSLFADYQYGYLKTEAINEALVYILQNI